MIVKKIIATPQQYKLWKALPSLMEICYSKISFKNNIADSVFINSPLVGYYRLSSVIKTFTTSLSLAHKNLTRSFISPEMVVTIVEISNERALGSKLYMGYFSLWPMVNKTGFYVLLLPIEKLLFDILKNLVTFTPSNHCMYGGKRYN